MSRQRILIGTAGTLISYPRVPRQADGGATVGRIAGGTQKARVGTPSTSMPTTLSAAQCTLDTLSTTTTASAAEGATSLAVSPAASFVAGREYILTLPSGERIIVRASVTGSSSAPSLEEPLPIAVPSGTTVQGYAVIYTFTTGETSIQGDGLSIFEGAIDGVTFDWTEPFTIVRRFLRYTLTPTRLQQMWPTIRTRRSRQDTTLEETIRIAWEYRILPLLAARDIDEDEVVSADALEPLHALSCMLQIVIADASAAPEFVERLEQRWWKLQESTFARKDWWQVSQEIDTPSPVPPMPPKLISGLRLTR